MHSNLNCEAVGFQEKTGRVSVCTAVVSKLGSVTPVMRLQTSEFQSLNRSVPQNEFLFNDVNVFASSIQSSEALLDAQVMDTVSWLYTKGVRVTIIG